MDDSMTTEAPSEEPQSQIGIGVEMIEVNGKPRVTLPAVVKQLHRLGQSIIPVGIDKRPVIKNWTQFQVRQPTAAEFKDWLREHGASIAGWARITGAISGVVVLDDDQKDESWFGKWGVNPHVRTGSGGLHWIGRHPGWRVKTLNSKSSKKLGETYPGLDMRADGGYSLVAGFNTKGGYTWLRDPADIAELDELPEEVREFFGLLHAPAEREVLLSQSEIIVPTDMGAVLEQLLKRALVEARKAGRNNGGHWLAQQLHDHGFSAAEILDVGHLYVDLCSPTNLRGEPEEYTIDEFRATLEQVSPRPRREPWVIDENLVLEDLTPMKAALDEVKTEESAIDRFLVPSDLGARKRYPPWAIQDFVRVGHRVIFYGVSGSAKSYAAIDLARAAVTGTEWLGKQVRAGSVVYVAAEDYIGVHHRIEAAITHRGDDRLHQVRVYESSIGFTSHDDVHNLLEMFDHLPEKPSYLIIDNLSLCMGDGDPNEGTAAKLFVDGCEMIQRYRWRAKNKAPEVRASDVNDITVVIIHHTNKLGNFNGSQYFQNFVDAMSELKWDPAEKEEGGVHTRTIYCRKQRHGEWHKPMVFTLLQVDDENKLCVVEHQGDARDASKTEKARKRLSVQEHGALKFLWQEITAWGLAEDSDDDLFPGVLGADIMIEVGIPHGSLWKTMNKLKNAGLVQESREKADPGRPKPLPRYHITAAGISLLNDPDLVVERREFRGTPKTDKLK